MAVLAPPVAFTYPEFQAYRAAPTIGGAVANSAAKAAASTILGNGAILLGGFIAGYAVGEGILRGLQDPNLLPPMDEGIVGGRAGNQYVLTIKSDIAPFGSVTQENTITGAWGAIYFRYTQPESGVFDLITSNGTIPIFSCNVEDVRQAPVIIAARRLDGTPEAFRKTPLFPAKRPVQPPVVVPDVIPVPGRTDPFPLTPTVYPSPETDPDQEPNKLFPPGVTVKIPETGDQYTFTPNGVSYSRSTPTSPFPLEQPQKQPIPPDKKVATQPCPCPEKDVDLEEVLCRLKALQDEILDDGFNKTVTSTAIAVSGRVEQTSLIFDSAEINVTQFPGSTRTQPSDFPAPDVLYIGWFSWLSNGSPGERLPLHYQASSFIAPPGATGFIYQLNKACLGFGRYVTVVKKPYIDRC